MAEDNKNPEKEAGIQLESNFKLIQKLRKATVKMNDETTGYRNILRDISKQIKNSDEAYARIEARLKSLNKDTINIRDVENELFKSKQQVELSNIKLKKLEETRLDLLNQGKIITQEEVAAAERMMQSMMNQNGRIKANKREEYERLEILVKASQNMEQALDAAKEASQAAKENVKNVEGELKIERAVNKEVGVKTELIGRIGKLLGIEEEVRKSIVKQTREGIELDEDGNVIVTKRVGLLKMAQKAMKEGTTNTFKDMSKGAIAMKVASKGAGAMGLALQGVEKVADAVGGGMSKLGGTIRGLSPDASTFFSEMTGPVKDLLGNIPILGGLLSGLVDVFSGVLDLVIGIDNRIVKASRQLGMSVEQGRALNTEFQAMAANSDKIYVNTRKLWENYGEIAKMTGLNNRVSQEFLETNIELTEFAGLEADARAKIFETAKITGQTAKGTTEAILGQVYALEKATGISFNQQGILKEVASLGGRLGLEFSKYPGKLTQALLQTKALGLELKELNSMASGFLDFESSISKEFEAQLLTGRDINLMKARELFLNNDLAGAAAEITRQVGSTADFLKMNRIQQEVFASSMEMSVDQMAEMLKKQELYSKFAVTDQKGLIKKIELMRQQGRIQEAIAKAGGEEAYQNLINLSLQDKLMQAFDKIKESLTDFLTSENVLSKIQEFVDFLSDPKRIRSMVDTVRGYVADILGFIGRATAEILEIVGAIGNFFTFGEKGDKFESVMEVMASKLREGTGVVEASLKRSIGTKVEPEKEQSAGAKTTTVSAKDAVLFPNNNLVVNKDPLDYTIFTKNPSAIAQPAPQIDMNQLTIAITNALNQRPLNVSLNANLAMDGQPAAKVIVTNIKNSVITSFDRQSGPMSQNA